MLGAISGCHPGSRIRDFFGALKPYCLQRGRCNPASVSQGTSLCVDEHGFTKACEFHGVGVAPQKLSAAIQTVSATCGYGLKLKPWGSIPRLVYPNLTHTPKLFQNSVHIMKNHGCFLRKVCSSFPIVRCNVQIRPWSLSVEICQPYYISEAQMEAYFSPSPVGAAAWDFDGHNAFLVEIEGSQA